MHRLGCCPPLSISISPFPSRHFHSLGFLQFKPLAYPKSVRIIAPIFSRTPSEEQLPIPDDGFGLESGGEEEDDDDEDDEFEEYEDDEIAADEYTIEDDAEASEEGGEMEETDSDLVGSYGQSEEEKAERVKKLIAEAREFGAEIIDYQELAGIFDFPIDKFQVDYLESIWFTGALS